jgi:5-methylcytosine-specific restriction enzyme A
MPETHPKRAHNPPWSREEIILALDFYLTHGVVSNTDPRIVELSAILNRLPIHTDRPDPDRFRNVNGVLMKIGNLQRFDTNYKGRGLQNGGRLEEEIWNEFAHDLTCLHALAEQIRGAVIAGVASSTESADEELAFPEGAVLYRLHRSKERSRKLVELLKSQTLATTGKLACEACGFDFSAVYGEVGNGIIEAHHNTPISELDAGAQTKVSDLSLLCANCHTVIHRRRPWLTVLELTRTIRRLEPRTCISTTEHS